MNYGNAMMPGTSGSFEDGDSTESRGGMDSRWLDIMHALLRSPPPGGGTMAGGLGALGGAVAGRGVRRMLGRRAGREAGSSIDALRFMPGGGIPHFATGGIVTDPTLAMVGDRGPEAIVPLGIGQGGSFFDKYRKILRDPQAYAGAGGSVGQLLKDSSALGPDYLRSKLRRSAMGTADAMRRRATVSSRLFGLDPMQQRQEQVNADIAANSDLAGSLNAADLQGAGGYQDYIRKLLMDERRFQQEKEMAAIQQRYAQENQPSFWGQALGTGLGVASKFIVPH